MTVEETKIWSSIGGDAHLQAALDVGIPLGSNCENWLLEGNSKNFFTTQFLANH